MTLEVHMGVMVKRPQTLAILYIICILYTKGATKASSHNTSNLTKHHKQKTQHEEFIISSTSRKH